MDQRIFAVFLIPGFDLILVVHDGISTDLYFIVVSSDFQCFDNIKQHFLYRYNSERTEAENVQRSFLDILRKVT